nr:hypothetical protein [Streptomyces sp. CB02120-2]
MGGEHLGGARLPRGGGDLAGGEPAFDEDGPAFGGVRPDLGRRVGEIRNAAPASSAVRACAAVVTVPTPIRAGRPMASESGAVRATAPAQPGTVVVSSTARQPPASRAVVRRTASSAWASRSTGSSRWAASTS